MVSVASGDAHQGCGQTSKKSNYAFCRFKQLVEAEQRTLCRQSPPICAVGDRDGFIRMDMTEYQSKHEAAKFIGSPPGYSCESGDVLLVLRLFSYYVAAD